MKKVLAGVIAGLALGVGTTWLATRAPEGAASAKAETAATPEKPKENPLHLSPARRAAAGITLARPATASLPVEINAFGRVLDPAPLIALTAELEAARAALAASEKAAARAKELFQAGAAASAQTLEAAEAAAARDRIAVSSAQARLLAGWGRRLADMASLNTLASRLEAGAALVRIDLLPGQEPAPKMSAARVGLTGRAELFAAEILGAAPSADPQLQGAGYLALVSGRGLPAGATLRAILAGSGEAVRTLVLPRTAVVYHQGSPWVYILEKGDTFERRLVVLGRGVDESVAIASGIEADDQCVTTGAGQLLSAELQAGASSHEG